MGGRALPLVRQESGEGVDVGKGFSPALSLAGIQMALRGSKVPRQGQSQSDSAQRKSQREQSPACSCPLFIDKIQQW